MFAYLVRRLLWLPVLLVLISAVTFALGIYGPGDPVQVMVGLKARPDIIQRIREEYGFDQPFHVQYLNYITNALRGNFGYSLVKYQGQPVGALIAKRLPVTIQLNLVAVAWSVPLGIALGIFAALRRASWFDVFVRAVVILGISLPIIGLQPVLTFVFSRKHELGPLDIGPFLPVGGWLIVDGAVKLAADGMAFSAPRSFCPRSSWGLAHWQSFCGRRAPRCWMCCTRITSAWRAPKGCANGW